MKLPAAGSEAAAAKPIICDTWPLSWPMLLQRSASALLAYLIHILFTGTVQHICHFVKSLHDPFLTGWHASISGHGIHAWRSCSSTE